MENNNEKSRRKFIRSLATSAAAITVGTNLWAADAHNRYVEKLFRSPFSANDNINIALIGAGGMGTQDTLTALLVPGVKLVAICDLYDGRLAEAKKKWGADFLLHVVIKRY